MSIHKTNLDIKYAITKKDVTLKRRMKIENNMCWDKRFIISENLSLDFLTLNVS
jgi:hypothetical protein